MKNIGIDTGASFTRVWDGEHEVLRLRTARAYSDYLEVLDKTLCQFDPIKSLVIAFPAIIVKQRIIKIPNLGSDWEGKDIRQDIHRLLRVVDTLVLQDTEAAGYGVQRWELDGKEPTLLVTLSTGVGGALVTRELVMPLEIGHMPLDLSGEHRKCGCGQCGCAETDLSGTGIYNASGVRPEDIEDVDFWSNYGTKLGKFLLVLSALFKLRQIILTGGVSQRYSLFIEQTRLYLEANLRISPVPTIRLSHIGDELGVYGAYQFASSEAIHGYLKRKDF